MLEERNPLEKIFGIILPSILKMNDSEKLKKRRERNKRLNTNKILNPDDIKYCNGCKQEKNVMEFGTSKRNKDGLKYRCKECINKKRKENYTTVKFIKYDDKNINSYTIKKITEKLKKENIL